MRSDEEGAYVLEALENVLASLRKDPERNEGTVFPNGSYASSRFRNAVAPDRSSPRAARESVILGPGSAGGRAGAAPPARHPNRSPSSRDPRRSRGRRSFWSSRRPGVTVRTGSQRPWDPEAGRPARSKSRPCAATCNVVSHLLQALSLHCYSLHLSMPDF